MQAKEHLSIFGLDPKIFINRIDRDEDDFQIKTSWGKLEERLLGPAAKNRTSEIGALIWDAIDEDGNRFSSLVMENYELLENEPKAIFDELMQSGRIVDELYKEDSEQETFGIVAERLTLSDLEEIGDDCISSLLEESESLNGFISYTSFFSVSYTREDWWLQFEPDYTECNLDTQLSEFRNILLYSEDISIFDREWEPDNKTGYLSVNKIFELIQCNRLDPVVRIHRKNTDDFHNWLGPTKVEAFCDRAKAKVGNVKVKIYFWRKQYIHFRAICCSYGGYHSSYGVQEFDDASQLYTPIPAKTLTSIHHAFIPDDNNKAFSAIMDV